MSIQLLFPFDNASNYQFDTNKIVVSGGKVSLKIVDFPDQEFNQPFDSDSGFTYDNTKAEFTGGKVQQKSQVPANATFGATYTNDINGIWGDGILTGTPIGGASVISNRLDLSNNDIRYVNYDANGNADSQQTITIKGKYTFNYTGSAPATNELFCITKENGSLINLIRLYHTSTMLFWQIYDQSGASILSQSETFSPVVDTQYEIALCIDLDTPATRLFVDGVQLGSTNTSGGIRSADIGLLRIGSDRSGIQKSNLYLEDFVVYNNIQYVANYTPGYTLPEYKFPASDIICPEMEYTGVGTLQLLSAFTVIDANTPKYTIQVGRSGDYLYWNGSAWVVSDNTYEQANDEATFNANCQSLDIEGEVYGQFRIFFNGNNDSQQSVSDLTATVTGQQYCTDNPTIEGNTTWRNEGLDGFIETATKTGSDEIKYILKKGDSYYYHDGADWVVSDQTYAQSNTASEIEANKASFTDSAVVSQFKAFLHSEDGTSTPEIDQLEINYDYAGSTPDTIETCIVSGYVRYADSDYNQLSITIKIDSPSVKYKNTTRIYQEDISVTPNSIGYWEKELIECENMEGAHKYIFTINGTEYFRTVPNQETANFEDLT